MGVAMSELVKHGGLYSLNDMTMMERRLSTMTAPLMSADPIAGTRHMSDMMAGAARIPTFFFYHIVNRPYRLHARLVSYLTYPNRHLRSPVMQPPPPDAPDSSPGKTFTAANTPSNDITAAMTFVGQFIDHDLTLNAMNLFDDQTASIRSQASPFIDLDSVYGARLDDPVEAMNLREIPTKDGEFCLRPIKSGKKVVGYDVCRQDKGKFGQHFAALIGDKRNDENQIILQVHILLMRLHNAFMQRYAGTAPAKARFTKAKTQTVLHWQAMIVTQYLRLVCDPAVVDKIVQRLTTCQPLVYRPGQAICGGTRLAMAHEFAIGFRFGHSQLRSRYQLNPDHEFRLFDSLSDGSNDLQGGKCLDAARLIDWPYFLKLDNNNQPLHKSNLIDTEVNQVVFDLPESTIPDDITLVSNLPFRNLVRSDSVGLCSGEDLAIAYAAVYGTAAVPILTPAQVEPDAAAHPIFQLDECFKNPDGTDTFRTPLWYYLLREAEVAREPQSVKKGHLGPLGSHLVAEVILSAIYFAPISFLNQPHAIDPIPRAASSLSDPIDAIHPVTLLDIATFANANTAAPPACPEGEPCP